MTDSTMRWGPWHAQALATSMLRDNPDRLAHSLRAAIQARSVCATVSPRDADLLVAAALLHDIGYVAALRQTGFHAIDGARFLVKLDAPPRLAALVAHHSESWLLAEAAGLLAALSRFRREEGPVADALAYADMTAAPTGDPISVADRLADIAARHANEDPVMLAARLARVPRLMAAEQRV
jgi:putative nucleotidyltransferase with HDIG domain